MLRLYAHITNKSTLQVSSDEIRLSLLLKTTVNSFNASMKYFATKSHFLSIVVKKSFFLLKIRESTPFNRGTYHKDKIPVKRRSHQLLCHLWYCFLPRLQILSVKNMVLQCNQSGRVALMMDFKDKLILQKRKINWKFKELNNWNKQQAHPLWNAKWHFSLHYSRTFAWYTTYILYMFNL